MGPYYDTAQFPERLGEPGSMLATDLHSHERFLPHRERPDRITFPAVLAVLAIIAASVLTHGDRIDHPETDPVVAAYSSRP